MLSILKLVKFDEFATNLIRTIFPLSIRHFLLLKHIVEHDDWKSYILPVMAGDALSYAEAWLNIVEIALSVLSQQCLDRRIATVDRLHHEIIAWQEERNQSAAKVVWQFSTEDARVKLKHLYPVFEVEKSESILSN